MVIKERPNKTIREYGKVTKAGVVLVKKRNPTLTTSPWKKRAMGLYGTLLVFSEVGHEDQVREDDQVTEELPLPRSAQVVMHNVLGVPCVCVETSRQPIIFRPVDERQVQVLHEWAEAIRSAVMPPEPGTVDPMIELEALMQRKDLTPGEAQRAQALMRARGSEKSSRIQGATKPVAKELLPSDTAGVRFGGNGGHQAASIGTNLPVNSMQSWGDGQSLFGQQHSSSVQISNFPVSQSNRDIFDDDVFAGISDFSGQSSVALPAASETSGAVNIFAGHASVHASENSSLPLSADTAAPARDVNHQAQSAKSPPPSDVTLSTVHDGDGDYYGCITRDGTCLNSDGVCIGYLNDAERTAGSSRGEYLGCVSETRRGEAMVETPNGVPIAKIDLGFGRLLTLGGSTVAEFRNSGDVVADLGHQICRFDALSLHDQPIMSLYLSFLAPDLLQAAASIVHGSNIGPVQIPSSTLASTVPSSNYGAAELPSTTPVPNVPSSNYGAAQLPNTTPVPNVPASNYGAAQLPNTTPVPNVPASNYGAAQLPNTTPVPNVPGSNFGTAQLPNTAPVLSVPDSNYGAAQLPNTTPVPNVPGSNFGTAQRQSNALVSDVRPSNYGAAGPPSYAPVSSMPTSNYGAAPIPSRALVSNVRDSNYSAAQLPSSVPNVYASNHGAAQLPSNAPMSNVPANRSTAQVPIGAPVSNVDAFDFRAAQLPTSAPESTLRDSNYTFGPSFGPESATHGANYGAAQDQSKGNASTSSSSTFSVGAREGHESIDQIQMPNNLNPSQEVSTQNTNTAPPLEKGDGPISFPGTLESTSFPLRQSDVPKPMPTSDSNNESRIARPRYVAIASFNAECTDWQVSIERGEVCRLEEDHGDGWTTVQLEKSQLRGAVPTAFIEEAIDAPPVEPQSNNDSTVQLPSSYTRAQVTVAHSFEAQDSSWQVTVTQGEQIAVSKEYDDGWTEVVKGDGSKGMVPTAFLRP